MNKLLLSTLAKSNSNSNKGFTLIELLIVIIIVGIVFGIFGRSLILGPSWNVTGKISLESRFIPNENGYGSREVFYVQVTDPQSGSIVEPGTFKVGDDFLAGHFDSFNTLAEAKQAEGKVCIVSGRGWRNGFFSLVPTVHKLSNCQ